MNHTILNERVIALIDWHILRISWLNCEINSSVNQGEDKSHFLHEYDEHILALREFGLCKKMMTTKEIVDDLIID